MPRKKTSATGSPGSVDELHPPGAGADKPGTKDDGKPKRVIVRAKDRSQWAALIKAAEDKAWRRLRFHLRVRSWLLAGKPANLDAAKRDAEGARSRGPHRSGRRDEPCPPNSCPSCATSRLWPIPFSSARHVSSSPPRATSPFIARRVQPSATCRVCPGPLLDSATSHLATELATATVHARPPLLRYRDYPCQGVSQRQVAPRLFVSSHRDVSRSLHPCQTAAHSAAVA